jgi:eukaryotic-like serine/threonine-protein kinase
VNLFAGRYELGRVLGAGGMAKVYAAHDHRLDRPVAVKLVPTAQAEPISRQRFVREARSAAAFTHPNAVALFDAGEAEGFLYLVMEFVDGQSLTDRLAVDGQLDPGTARHIAAGVLAALAAAHAVGIVHRDVKPGNIILGPNGIVKLADFGIAKRLDDAAGDVTVIGDIVGTPNYLAPELLDGRPATPSSDVYAVGVVVFEMLAGRPPFEGDTPLATAVAHRNHPVPDIAALRPDIPTDLGNAVKVAMAKDPARRYASAAVMSTAIGGDPLPSKPTTRLPMAPTQVISPGYGRGTAARWWGPAAAGLVAAAAVLTFLVVNGDDPNAATPTDGPSTTSTPAVTTTAVATTAPPTTVPSPSPTQPAANPATIEGVIASLQADPDAFGRRADEVIRDLEKISRGEGDVEGRTTDLLTDAAEWVDQGELDPAVLAMLDAVLVPPASDNDEEGDDD